MLEDVSDSKRRQKIEEKLNSTVAEMKMLESQLSALHVSSARVA